MAAARARLSARSRAAPRPGRPALAALPPGPHSAPQEGEGRGAVAAARLTEPGGPLKGAAPRARGGARRARRARRGGGARAPSPGRPPASGFAPGETEAPQRRTGRSDAESLLEQERLDPHFTTARRPLTSTRATQRGAGGGKSPASPGGPGCAADARSPVCQRASSAVDPGGRWSDSCCRGSPQSRPIGIPPPGPSAPTSSFLRS